MPLQKFAPVSPDPSIQTDGDMTLAKFGHLNSVIDYINTYVAADSLQLEGTGSLSATPRYITDAGGNLSSLAISTGNVGIGTNTPLANLHINGHVGYGYSLRISTDVPNGVAYAGLISDYVTGVEQYQHGGPGWGWPNWTTTRTGGTAAAPTAVPNNYGLNEYSFWGHDGTAAGQAYSMMTRAAETWTPAGHGIYTTFNTAKIGATGVSERMRFTGLGNVTFNNASDSAIVSIKGTGSTSATTSLLVQNSSAMNSMKVGDDGVTSLISGTNTTFITLGQTAPNSLSVIDATGYVAGRAAYKFTNINGGVNSQFSAYNLTWVNRLSCGNQGNTGLEIIGATGTPAAGSAVLDLQSTTQGFLPPRMTTAQKLAIPTPTAGLMVYDTDLNKSFTYDGTTWQAHW